MSLSTTWERLHNREPVLLPKPWVTELLMSIWLANSVLDSTPLISLLKKWLWLPRVCKMTRKFISGSRLPIPRTRLKKLMPPSSAMMPAAGPKWSCICVTMLGNTSMLERWKNCCRDILNLLSFPFLYTKKPPSTSKFPTKRQTRTWLKEKNQRWRPSLKLKKDTNSSILKSPSG